jgi:small-conductance mechanosensitive channel
MLWPAAVVHLGEVVKSIYTGGIAALTGASHGTNTADRLPVVIGIVIAGLALLTLGQSLFERWDALTNEENHRTNLLWRFVSDMLALLMPIIGLYMVVTGIELLNLFTPYLENILLAFVPAGMTAIATRWLSQRFFPQGERMGPLHYYEEKRGKLRRTSLSLGLTIAAGIMWSTVINLGEIEEGTRLVLLLPIHLLSGLLLFRFGKLIIDPPDDADPDMQRSVPRTRSIVGRGIMLIGIVAPLLAALGFGNATQALIVPAVQTLAVLGVVILAQKLVNDIAMRNRVRDSEDAGPLAPLLIGALFVALALPVLALIWGATGGDLLQYWARFRTGFTLGETRISPGDFMTLLIVFLVGFLLTRFVQGTLRNSVLPRTKLDLGGQNAVVTGFGYLGITMAALVGITTAGIDLSNLAIVAGALSVGIGFGLQTVVSNFVSGIILLIERPISEGELIEINGQLGYVRDISVRSTRIETFDRKDVIIPNADLVSQQVINWTRGNVVGRAIVAVGVAYGSDLEQVKEIMKEVAMENPMVLHNPPPGVLFMGFGDSSLDFEVRAILRDVNFIMEVKSEVGLEIARRFKEAGIHIPFPQRDVWMRQAQGPSEEPAT